eukprot:scaffold283058_cov33-Tisochrysis_lutea.AAC.2
MVLMCSRSFHSAGRLMRGRWGRHGKKTQAMSPACRVPYRVYSPCSQQHRVGRGDGEICGSGRTPCTNPNAWDLKKPSAVAVAVVLDDLVSGLHAMVHRHAEESRHMRKGSGQEADGHYS